MLFNVLLRRKIPTISPQTLNSLYPIRGLLESNSLVIIIYGMPYINLIIFLKWQLNSGHLREKTFVKTGLCFQKTIIDNFDNI